MVRVIIPVLLSLALATSAQSHNRMKFVEVVNPNPIPVEIQEPLQVEVVNASGPPNLLIHRTVLRDANDILVATIPGEFDPSSIYNIAVIKNGEDEIAVYATQNELRGIVRIEPSRRYETEDCSGEEAAGFFHTPHGFYNEGSIVGNVTHRILIRFLTDRFPREIYNLPPDPEMIPKTREGA